MRRLARYYERERQKGRKLSGIIHFFVFLLVIFGLPSFLEPTLPPEPTAISVEVLPISAISNIKPSDAPKAEKKPEPKPEPKEEKKPTPPVKTDEPPPPPPPPEKPAPVKEKPPEPKKPEKKEEKKKKDKKEDDLAAVLKAVKDTAKKQNDKPNKEKKEDSGDTAKSKSDNYNADLPMSMSEQDAIRSQIAACWSVPAGAKDAHNLIVVLRLQLEEDGTVISVELSGDSKARYGSDSFFRSAADSAMRAVRQCSPLKNLPPEKYGTWRDMELTFDPRDMLY